MTARCTGQGLFTFIREKVRVFARKRGGVCTSEEGGGGGGGGKEHEHLNENFMRRGCVA